MLSKVMPKKSVAAVNLRTANRTLGGDLNKRGALRTDGRRRNSTSARRSRTRGQRRPGRLSASHAARKGRLRSGIKLLDEREGVGRPAISSRKNDQERKRLSFCRS